MRSRSLVIGQSVGRNVGAHEHHRRAECLHDVELALRAVEIALQDIVRDALEVAERLIEINTKPKIGRHRTHIAGRTVEIDKIVLEDFDGIEARGRDRFELFA